MHTPRPAALIVALSLALCAACGGPERTPDASVAVHAESSTYRVSRRFAAGLEYLLLEPRDLPEDAELPMIVYVHGRSSVPTPPDGPFYGLEVPVRVIMPRAPDRSGPGYSWMPVSASTGESPELVGPLVERSRMLAEATIEWRRRHPTRGLPIVVGFSQGGMIAMELAMSHPGAIAEAIPLAAWLPPSRMPAAPRDVYAPSVPIHALHGADDPILSASRTAATFARLRELGYPADLELIEGTGHEASPALEARASELLRAALERLPEVAREAGQS